MPETDRDPYHYAVIGRALKQIDQGGPGMTLDDLAGRMGMSPAHFQRVFSQWVGVSPKRYQQYLTLDHARRLLAERLHGAGHLACHRACRAAGGCTTCSCGGRR